MKKRIRRIPVFALALLLCGRGIAAGGPAGIPPAAEVALLADGDFLPRITEAVGRAVEEVVICTYLFRTSGRESNAADRLAEALVAAAARGVSVRVVLEQDADNAELSADNRRTGRALSQRGVRVIYDDPRVTAHAKLAVIDRRLSFIGSHNLTDSALRRNREVSVMVDSRAVAERLLEYIKGLEAK